MFIMCAHRPANETSKKVFFDELNETLDKAVNKYGNIFIAGDLNIDTGDESKDTNNYLCDFMNLFCTFLNIMLTNIMRSFQETSTVTTGISDCHKMIVTYLKAHFKKLRPKKIVYRDYRNFNKNIFLYDLDQNLMQGKFYSQKNAMIYLLKLLKALPIIMHP